MSNPNDPQNRATRTTVREGRRGRGAMWFIASGLVASIVLIGAFFMTRNDNLLGGSPAAVEDAPDPGAETTAPTTAEETAAGDPAPEADPATGEATPADEPAPADQPDAEAPAPADIPAEPPAAEPSLEPDADPPPED